MRCRGSPPSGRSKKAAMKASVDSDADICRDRIDVARRNSPKRPSPLWFLVARQHCCRRDGSHDGSEVCCDPDHIFSFFSGVELDCAGQVTRASCSVGRR